MYGTYPTDNPAADYNRYQDKLQKELDKLPICYECGEPIQDEECYEINDELICPECLLKNHRKFTDDYTDD